MNRIFRIVWNHVRGACVVCSEIAKSCKKSKSLNHCSLVLVGVCLFMSGHNAIAGKIVSGGSGQIFGDVYPDDDIIGGKLIDGKSQSIGTATGKTLTLTGTLTGELIGGSYVRQTTGNHTETVNGDIRVVIDGGTVKNGALDRANYVAGGGKTASMNGESGTSRVNGNTTVEMKSGTTGSALAGGGLAKAQAASGNAGTAEAEVTGQSGVIVSGGTVNGVIGGGQAEAWYSGTANVANTASVSSTTGASRVDISSGTVNKIRWFQHQGTMTAKTSAVAVAGGGLALGNGAVSNVAGDTSLHITGGAIEGMIVGGGVTDNGVKGGILPGTTVGGNTNIFISGPDTIIKDDIVGGGYGYSTVAGNTNIIIQSLNGQSNGDIMGGGRLDTIIGGTSNTVAGKATIIIDGTSETGYQGNVYGGGMVNSYMPAPTTVSVGSTDIRIGKDAIINESVFGGGRIRGQETGNVGSSNVTGSTNVYVAGKLNGVAGGGWAHGYLSGNSSADVQANVGGAHVTVDGGTVGQFVAYSAQTDGQSIGVIDGSKVAVVGGGVSTGQVTKANAASTEVIISGHSTINGDIVGGGYVVKTQRAGTLSSGGTAHVSGDTHVVVESGSINGYVYGGGYASDNISNADVGGNVSVDITGGDFNNNLVYGGGKNSSVTGNIYVNVSDATNLRRVTAAGKVDGIFNKIAPAPAIQKTTGSTFLSFTSGTIGTGAYLDGLFGGGFAAGGTTDPAQSSSLTTKSTRIEMTGGTVDGYVLGSGKADDFGIVNITNGTQVDISGGTVALTVFGGGVTGWANGVAAGTGGGKLNNVSSVVTVSGNAVIGDAKTAGELVDNGIISGSVYGGDISAGSGTAKTGQTTVNIKGGTVYGSVIGGSHAGFNGYSEVGIGTGNAVTVNLTGGHVEGDIFGGSFGYWHTGRINSEVIDGDQNLRTKVKGDILVNVAGTQFGKNSSLYGAGYSLDDTGTVITHSALEGNVRVAQSAGILEKLAGGFKVESFADPYNNQAFNGQNKADVIGNVFIDIKGGSVRNLFGGSYVTVDKAVLKDDNEGMSASSTMTGNTAINISGGTVGNVYGGGYTSVSNTSGVGTVSATSIINGNAAITVSGGTITGDIYGGGYGSGSIVNGSTTVTFLNGSSFAGNVYGGAADGGIVKGDKTLAFGSDASVYNDAFNGKFSGFDNLTVASGSMVRLDKLDFNDIGSQKLTLNGTGTVAVNTIEKGTTLDVKSGTLQTESAQVFEKGLQDGTITNATGKRDTEVTFSGGSLALNDSRFNLEYVKSAGSIIGTKTKLVMLGTLIDESGNAKNEVKIDELAAVNSTLAGVQVNTGNKNLVIGGDTTGNSESLNQDVGVGSLNLGDAREVTVKNGNALTLTGNGGSSISSTSSEGVTVKVGDGTESGTLNLGSDAVGQNGQINGNIVVSGGSAVNVAGGTQTITGQGITTSGSATVNVQSGATLNSMLVLNNDAKLNVTGNLNADKLTGSEDVVINIGNNAGAGKVSARDVSLGGAKLFLDPAWKEGGNSISEASQGAFVFSGAMDGKLSVGQNSLMVLGDTSTSWAQSEFLKSGKTWGQDGITAALIVRAPVTLDTLAGSINVDGSLTETSLDTSKYENVGNVRFADKSLLLVDANNLKGNAAIRGTGASGTTATVESGAALHVSNMTTQGATILDGFGSLAVNGWNGNNLTSADALMDIALDTSEAGKVKVTATQKNASDALAGIAMPNGMNAIWGAGLNDTASTNAGIRFLSRAADDTFLDRNDAVRTINGAAQMAVAAGVQSTTITAAQMPQRAINNHLSLTGNAAQKGMRLHEEGFDAWGEVMYNNTHASGFKAGSLSSGYNTDMGGFVVGGDYTFADNGNGKVRLGGAFNLGTGESSSRGDFNHTKNDFDFWGINLYGGWNKNDLNVIANIGYSRSSNELNQTLPTGMQMGNLKADVDSSVLSLGLKGEYRLKTRAVDIIPHIGIRYLNVTMDGFTTKNNDGNLFHTEKDRQNVWQFPVGVAFTKDYRAENGWTIKPKLDLSIVPSTGDVDATTRIRVSGISALDTITSRVMDRTSFDGTLGVDMQKGNMTLGLRYGLQKSSNQTDQAGMATFSYKF